MRPVGVLTGAHHRLAGRMVAGLLVALLGVTLLGLAAAANQQWWDRHFLPVFSVGRSTLIAAEQTVRGLAALAGVALLLIRRPAALLSRATIGGGLRILLAVVLGLGAGELILRLHPPHVRDADPMEQEPRRQPDPLLGWIFVPARSVAAEEAGRAVSYSFDAAGRRVSSREAPVDVEQPTLLFTGESIMAGFGLRWEETIPARVGALLGMQSANLAVFDYSNDQSFLRLAVELPRFRKPLAVVTLFMPSLFDRNLLDNRPRLAAGLEWRPANEHWRLVALLRWLVPYRTGATVEQGVTRTRDSLQALVDLARTRGAEPLIVVPQFGPDEPVEAELSHRILDEAGLPYICVELDPAWRLSDRHPDPRAADAIAAAIANYLREHHAPIGSVGQEAR